MSNRGAGIQMSYNEYSGPMELGDLLPEPDKTEYNKRVAAVALKLLADQSRSFNRMDAEVQHREVAAVSSSLAKLDYLILKFNSLNNE